MSQQSKEEKKTEIKEKFNAEIILPLGNLRLKTNTSNTQSPGLLNKKQESEEDDEVERSYSPSKYFGKRPSFEFKNLKSIEKPLLNRQYSEFKFRDYNKLSLDKKISKEENIKVHFNHKEEIIENEDPDSMLDSKTLGSKKAAKSILKKIHIEDDPLDKIFDEKINKEIIDKILEESKLSNKHYKEFLGKAFIDKWRTIENNDEQAIRFLQVKLM